MIANKKLAAKRKRLSNPRIPVLALRLDEAAIALAVSESTLGEWATNKIIPTVKIGGVRMFPVRAIQHWLTKQALEGFTNPATTS